MKIKLWEILANEQEQHSKPTLAARSHEFLLNLSAVYTLKVQDTNEIRNKDSFLVKLIDEGCSYQKAFDFIYGEVSLFDSLIYNGCSYKEAYNLAFGEDASLG